MATITGFTAARMLQIEAGTVVSGVIQNDHLILTRRDGTEIDSGNVRGPQGLQGIPGNINVSPASGDLTGNYPAPVIAAGAVTGSKIADAIKDAAASVASLRTLGFTSTQAAPGDHTHAGLADSGWVSFVPTAGEAPLAAAAVLRAQYRKSGQLVHLRLTKNLTSYRDLRGTVDGDFANVLVIGLNSIPAKARPDNQVVVLGRIADHQTTLVVQTNGSVVWVGGSGAYYHTDDQLQMDAIYMTNAVG